MSRDNLSPTPGLRPLLARLRKAPDDTVTTETSAADNTDDYTRHVVLSQVVDESGKGTNPPRREIRTRLHHDDAFTLGVQLLKDAVATETRVLNEGKGGLRPRFWQRVFGPPSRHMPLYMARDTEQGIKALLARTELLEQYQPNIADYRINNVIHHLRAALRNAEYLTEDTTPDLDLARQHLIDSGFFKDADDGDAPEPGALTGDPATDARARDPRYGDGPGCTTCPRYKGMGTLCTCGQEGHAHRNDLPRLHSTGRYYITAVTSVPFKVTGVGTHAVTLTVTGEQASEYPEPIRVDRSEMGVWLVLDNEDDWITADEALGRTE